MTAYVIVDTKISDPEAYEGYKALARPIAEKFGGIYRARGGDMNVVENDLWTPTRIVILEFGKAWIRPASFLDCEEYAPVKAIRHANAQCTTVIIDGI